MSVIVKSTVDVAMAAVTAYNEKNWNALRSVLRPGIVYDEVATGRKSEGIGEVLTVWRGWANAMPDSKATFEQVVVDGNTVIFELTWRGTHTGPLQTPARTIPASGKKCEVRACQVVELAGEKVSSLRHYFDLGTLLRQIGAAPDSRSLRLAGTLSNESARTKLLHARQPSAPAAISSRISNSRSERRRGSM